jgi:hypothetical protein
MEIKKKKHKRTNKTKLPLQFELLPIIIGQLKRVFLTNRKMGKRM